MTALSDFAEFTCQATADSCDAQSRSTLRDHFADACIALVAGLHSPEGRNIAAICDTNIRADRVATASAVIRSTEVDDIHLQSCTTPASIVASVALLLAEDTDCAGVENAFFIGVETMVRIGLAIDGPSVLAKGVWPSCFAAPLSVAATASRLWGLDRETTIHALSMALMMSAGRTGRFGGAPSGRWILLKEAILAGIQAAAAARAGFNGDPALLDGDWLERTHGLPVRGEVLRLGFDDPVAVKGLSLKPFSTARQALAPTQALLELLSEGLRADAVEAIVVRTPHSYAGMISQPIRPDNRGSGYVSAAFQMALAALEARHLWDLDRAVVMHDREILDFAAKVKVEADHDLQSYYPDRWPGEIEVTTRNGVVRRRIIDVRGDASRPLTKEERHAKARNLLEPLIGADDAVTLSRLTDEIFASTTNMAAFKSALSAFELDASQ